MWSMLAVPPGMNLYPEKEPYPYDSLHLYQLVKRTVSGTYTAAVLVFSGTEEDFFHGGNLSYPLWIYTSLYKEGNRYYLIEFNGSHEAADALGDSLVYGLYQLKRSSK